LANLSCSLCMVCPSVCCKQTRGFSFSLVHDEHCPATSMAEYHMAKKKRRVVKTKLSILRTDVPSSQYNASGNLFVLQKKGDIPLTSSSHLRGERGGRQISP
jgi:hypothetical protein